MGKRNKVTTRDIADYTGLSQSTVSMVLSGKRNVSFTAETEEKVKEAARKLGYKKPVRKKAGTDSALSDTILVMAPLLTNNYYSSVIHSITDQALSYHYKVMTVVTSRDAAKETEYLSLAENSNPAGIIILYPINRVAEANALSRKIPIVLVGEKPDNVRFDSVELDSRKPGALVGGHLLSLGHRQAAFISTPIRKHEISRLRRLAGLRQAFQEAGLPEEAVEVFQPSPSEFRNYAFQSAEYQTGYEMTRKALSQGSSATAFVGQNDMTAYGIMAALRDQGFRIPRDCSVAGFDDAIFSSMPQISLTSVDHATVQKGRDAVTMIYTRNHQKDRPSHVTRMEYEPKLVIRNSTGPAPVRG